MYTVAADIMHNQRGIVAPLERCGWILLERASGEQYMYETGPKKRTQKPKTGCTCIFRTVLLLFVHAVSCTVPRGLLEVASDLFWSVMAICHIKLLVHKKCVLF